MDPQVGWHQVWGGVRFYNRSTAHLLRRVGLDELIASTPEEYIDVGVRMIEDVAFRDRVLRRLKIADLPSAVLSCEHVPSFVRLIDHRASLCSQSSRDPILID